MTTFGPGAHVEEDAPTPKVGRWGILVAGPSFAIDMTALGIALYGNNGELVFSKYTSIAKAMNRGDWKGQWMEVPHHEPSTWTEMLATFERMGNTMSSLRWIGGGATLRPTVETGEWLFQNQVMGLYDQVDQHT